MKKEYFKEGAFSVTAGMVRARTRSIMTGSIESVDVGRPFFWLALASGTGLAGLALPFGNLLYPAEIMTFVALGGAALAVTWPIGSLRVFSKLTGDKGWAVIGRMRTLRSMREAIETALDDTERKTARRGGMIGQEDDDA